MSEEYSESQILDYSHDIELCDHICNRIAVLLARGNYDGAFYTLKKAIEEELVEQTIEFDTMAIMEIESIDVRLANALEKHLGVIFLRDLRGISPDDIREMPNISHGGVLQVSDALKSLGLPFPLPELFSFPEPVPKFQHHQEKEVVIVQEEQKARSIADIIANAGEDELCEIDEQIAEYQSKIDKLKKARKVLGGSSSGGKPKSAGNVTARIVEFIDKNGPTLIDEIASELGVHRMAINGACRGGKLNYDKNTKMVELAR